MNNIIQNKISSLFLTKISIILFVVLSITGFNPVYAINSSVDINMLIKQKTVTVNVENESLEEILTIIYNQTNIEFGFAENIDVDKSKRYNLKVTDTSVESALVKLFSQTNYEYKIENDRILIVDIVEQQQPTANKEEKITIKGRVLDQDREPIIGATVLIKNSNDGAITDSNGDFILNVVVGTVIECSFTGYIAQSFRVTKEIENFEIVLKTDEVSMDDVTVVAYGVQKKRNVLGSISSVKSKDLEEVPTASLENLLQGQMAGVEVNNISGSPGGGGSRVDIRGYNSLFEGTANKGPLYVIDGVPVNSFTSPVTGTNTLAEIDPSTIESVEVLKDAASAAIYGSRAGNGVILITTKKGKAGTSRFSANVSQSFSVLPATPTQLGGVAERNIITELARNQVAPLYDMNTGGYRYTNSYEDAYYNWGSYDFFWQDGYSGMGTGYLPLQDSLSNFYNNSTNWWDYMFQTGKVTNANIQASGGTDLFKYMMGAGFYDEEGIMLGSNFQRINAISNLEVTPSKNFTLGMNLYAAYTDRSSGAANTSFTSASPIEGLTVDPKSNLTLLPGAGEILDNALKLLNTTVEKNISMRFRGAINGKYKITDNLLLTSSLYVDYTQSKTNAFTPSTLDPYYGLAMSKGQQASHTILSNDNLLTYFKNFNNHSFEFLLGHSFLRSSSEYIGGSGLGAPNDLIYYVGEDFPTIYDYYGTLTSMQRYYSDFKEEAMLSFFGRLSYNYKEKYLFEATLRRDGSTVFGVNNKWATFPSLAVGWVFSDEEFMRNLYYIDFAKVRLSWGKSGNTFDDPYLAHGVMLTGNSFLGSTAFTSGSILNEDLKWEETDQYNIGIDLRMLNSRVEVIFDYYYKYSTSLLWEISLPGDVYGHDEVLDNALELSNRGWELQVIADIITKGPVTWRTKLTLAANQNRFEKSYTGMDISANERLLVIGRPINTLYVYKDEGIIQNQNDIPKYYDSFGNEKLLSINNMGNPYTAGMRQLADFNMDGIIDSEDQYYAGSPLPMAHGGWANELKWGNFDLNALFSFSLGRMMINQYSITTLKFQGRYTTQFVDSRELKFWEKEGDVDVYPALATAGSLGQFDQSYDTAIENVHYVRLKQLTLGYNLPQEWVKENLKIQSARIFASAENLFLLTNYSGLDPEVVDPRTGIDTFSNYPLARKLTLGLSVNF